MKWSGLRSGVNTANHAGGQGGQTKILLISAHGSMGNF